MLDIIIQSDNPQRTNGADLINKSQPKQVAQLLPSPVIHMHVELEGHIDQTSTYPCISQSPPVGQFSSSQIIHTEDNDK